MPRPNAAQDLTASNALVWPVVDLLREVDADARAVLSELGLDEAFVYNLEGRTSLQQHHQLWQRAIEVTGDPAIGVRLAGVAAPERNVSWGPPLSLFEYMGVTAPTLGDAVELYNRFARILRDGMWCELTIDDETAMFRMESELDDPPALVEYNFAVVLSLARRITGRDLLPREIWFTHAAPSDTELHHRAYRAPIRWNARQNAILGFAEDYTRPLATANPVICARVVRQAERILGALPSTARFDERVQAQIRAELPGGNTNASAIAERLGVSCRTLHRRLRREDTTYQRLLDGVRFEQAVRHLGSGKTVRAVATLVGFAQTSTFNRAFKGWTGLTPSHYLAREVDIARH